MGIAPYLFLFLSCLAGVRSDVVLTQVASAVKKPGESYRLTCETRGFDLSSNSMHWVKQVSGKGLEWLVWYYSESYKYYAPGIQDRFTASKRSNNFYLQMNKLKVEDTATYYCARDTARGSGAGPLQKPSESACPQGAERRVVEGRGDRSQNRSEPSAADGTGVSEPGARSGGPSPLASVDGRGSHLAEITGGDGSVKLLYWVSRETEQCALDYWGKGTSLTVTSEVESLPSVFIAPPCHRESDQVISLLCLVKDYQPESIIQKWSTASGDITNGIKKYPAVLGQNAKYTMSSLLRVPAADWKSNNIYYCKAGYKSTEFVTASTKPIFAETQSPKLMPLVPSPEVLSNQTTAILGCVISGFSPDKIQVTWKKGKSEQVGTLLPSMKTDGGFETVAYLTLSVDEWTSEQEYSCEVTHKPSSFSEKIVMRYQGELFVSIQNPSIQEIWINKTATLVCTVISADPKKVHISWEVNGEDKSDAAVTQQPRRKGFQNTIISRLQTSVEEWSSGMEYMCSAQDHLSSPVSAWTKSTKVETKPPVARLLPPPYEEAKHRNVATLECVVSGFYPDHIDVTWKKGHSLISSNTSRTQTALEQDGTFSASHFLTVSSQEWKTGSIFSCTVSHPSSNTSITKEARNLQELSIFLQNPSTEEIWINKSATLVCLVVGADLSQVQIYWQVSGREKMKGNVTQQPREEGTQSTVISQFQTSVEEWYSGAVYTCSTQGSSSSSPVSAQTQSTKVEIKGPEVRLLPPTHDDTKSRITATLECVVSGFYPDLINVTWEKDSSLISSNTPTTRTALEQVGTFSASHFLTVRTDEWKKGSVFSCIVSHPPSNTSISREVKNMQGTAMTNGYTHHLPSGNPGEAADVPKWILPLIPSAILGYCTATLISGNKPFYALGILEKNWVGRGREGQEGS
ncbi:immunoglobulin mu heavy chain-like [Narcine bancroftii]|uniref:immunoglobulin mu heavy chain-like n=1 Tax=Narcine bancroftii TaxID=1343680 RepID=UPI0038314199